MRLIDLTGQTFGRWTVQERSGTGRTRWLCKCECGTTTSVDGATLKNGTSQSCGCLNLEITKANTTHGGARVEGYHPLYRTWKSMRTRCRNTNHQQWKDYGGRGIDVDPRWDSFENFLADMGDRPPNPDGWTSRKPYYTLDRYPDKDGDYAPGNVRWATPLEQSLNRRGINGAP